mmetsp:Transcript_5331/g.15659  ORF Transcript_5331/g.15659 Transcript_5331/m.15659 type:complete len:103 (-) Transcript_5331:323-631(-)
MRLPQRRSCARMKVCTVRLSMNPRSTRTKTKSWHCVSSSSSSSGGTTKSTNQSANQKRCRRVSILKRYPDANDDPQHPNDKREAQTCEHSAVVCFFNKFIII